MPIFNQPVLIYGCSDIKLQTVLQRTYSREVLTAVYIKDMFVTNNDKDNRASVEQYVAEELPLVGLGLFGDAKEMDKILRGVKLHF